ncbi:hypothetical protein CEXT_682771 [Caerostris extrusa]|uniref:Uncharacterized protein n=1 Tax=Caerostris extrusa TaxID=172846 RepID=A0AAV4QWI5_CAEEX|nr:hypothetical protein CEXT_682771 [Caerostris extrusa]
MVALPRRRGPRAIPAPGMPSSFAPFSLISLTRRIVFFFSEAGLIKDRVTGHESKDLQENVLGNEHEKVPIPYYSMNFQQFYKGRFSSIEKSIQ